MVGLQRLDFLAQGLDCLRLVAVAHQRGDCRGQEKAEQDAKDNVKGDLQAKCARDLG